MSYEFIAQNLKRLRVAQSRTQANVATSARISLPAYRNLEAGKSTPRVDTLERLASAFDVGLQDLVTPYQQLTHVRFRSTKRLNLRDDILAKVSRWLQDFNDLEEILGTRTASQLGSLREQLAGVRGPEEQARIVREGFGIGPDEPIRDICGLLESKGVKVRTLRVANDQFFGLSVGERDGGPAIAVNTWERISVERCIFTAAHELAHLLLHLLDYDVTHAEEQGTDRHEKEADAFAAFFLMPREVFRREWAETYGMGFVPAVLKVKRIFKVSWKTVVYRLQQEFPTDRPLFPIFQSQHRALYGHTLRKADEPHALGSEEFRPEPLRAGEPANLISEDFCESRLWALVRRAVEGEEISLARAAEILEKDLAAMRRIAKSWVGP